MNPVDEALLALAMMCEQYMSRDDGEIDHMSMSAGEYAVGVLQAHGLLEPFERGGVWTAKGRAALDAA